MTQAEFVTALETLGMPVANGKFALPTTTPFIVYQMSGDSDFKADNRHYYNIDNGTLELYTAKDEPDKEKSIEDKMEELGVPYSRLTKNWINSEKMQQVIWQIQLFE